MTIHCEDCEYFKDKRGSAWGDISDCLYLENRGTWYSSKEPRKHPKEINENMDCKWFAKKPT